MPVVFPLSDYPLLVFVICAASANCAADAQEEGAIGGLDRRRVFPVMYDAMN